MSFACSKLRFDPLAFVMPDSQIYDTLSKRWLQETYLIVHICANRSGFDGDRPRGTSEEKGLVSCQSCSCKDNTHTFELCANTIPLNQSILIMFHTNLPGSIDADSWRLH